MTSEVQCLGNGAAETAEWEQFVASAPGASAYHRLAWRRIITREFGWESHYLLARNPAGITGILPLVRLRSRLFGDFLVSLPYVNYGGSVSLDADSDGALLQQAADLAGSLGVRHMELREMKPRGSDWPARTDKVGMHLRLQADRDKQWQALGSKLRAQVRRPEREGATVRTGGIELLDEFYAVFAQNMRDLGTPVYSRSFFRTILEELHDQVDIVVATLAGRPAAGGFLIHDRGTTEIPWASSLRPANRVGINMLLYWHCLQRAIERGSAIFDFGRSTEDSGTYRFKRQWSAEPVRMYWHYWLANGTVLPRLNPDNPKFALAIAAWQRLPLWLATALGPHIVRNLP